MMISALIGSTVLLAIVLACARGGSYGQATTVAVIGTVGCIVQPVVAANAFVLALLGGVFLFGRWKPRQFFASALCGTGLVYVFVILADAQRLLEAQRLRVKYPIESLADRLAYETQRKSPGRSDRLKSAEPAGIAGAAKTSSELCELESQLSEDMYFHRTASSHNFWAPDRARALAEIHSSFVEQFVDSPGFGFARMRRRVDHGVIPLPESPPIRLPPRGYEDPSKADANLDLAAIPKGAASSMSGHDMSSSVLEFHRESYLNFVNPIGFGYIIDRNHVAGFQPHQFREMPSFSQPEETRQCKLEALDLLSLLKHPEPVAYVSDDLPRMDELRRAPVRSLDAFETKALAALRRGEELEINSTADRIRMLGSIRAGEQCVRCHDVDRGELLGAFSYRLRLATAPATAGVERKK